MRARRTDRSRITLVEEFLRSHRPEPDENVGRVAAMVEAVRTDRSILKVEDLAGRQLTIHERSSVYSLSTSGSAPSG